MTACYHRWVLRRLRPDTVPPPLWDSGLGAALGYDLGFSYENGALVPDGTALPTVQDPVYEYVPTAWPGSRVPYCWLSTEPGQLSTIDLFARDFVLLTGCRDSIWWSAAARIAAEGVPIRAVDLPAEMWAATYEVEPGGAVLVRPDGHVAWLTRAAARNDQAAERELRTVVDTVLRRLTVADRQPVLSTVRSPG